MTTNYLTNSNLKNNRVNRMLYALFLCFFLSFSTQKTQAQEETELDGGKIIIGDNADILNLNSDHSLHDSGIRLNGGITPFRKDWMLYNEKFTGQLHLGYYSGLGNPSYTTLTGSPVMSFETTGNNSKIRMNGEAIFNGISTFENDLKVNGYTTFTQQVIIKDGNSDDYFPSIFLGKTTNNNEYGIRSVGNLNIVASKTVGNNNGQIVFSHKDNGTNSESMRINTDGDLLMNDTSIKNAKSLRLKDWDDNTGGIDAKYEFIARDGAHMFYKGGVAVGTFDNGTWDDVPDGRLIVQKDMVIGDTELVPNTVLTVDGRVHISPEGGTETPFNVENFGDFLLWVEKGIVAADLAFGTPDEWEDRVFKADYILPSLREVESHINLFGHLPNFPSEKEIVAKGYSAHDMNKRFMRTLEELNLYAIAQDKKLKNKEQDIEQLQNTTKAQQQLIEQLSQRLAQLEAKVQE